MEQEIYQNALNWLRQGNETESASMLEKCELELHFVDMMFELQGERDFMMYDLTIYAPRNIFDLTKNDENIHVKQIQEAIKLSLRENNVLRSIGWAGKMGNPQTESPVQPLTLNLLQKTGVERIKLEWQRAINRLEHDPEGAITAARTLLESVCKLILDDKQIAYDNKDDLPKLYRKVTDVLDFAPDKQVNDIFRRVFGGTQTIVSGLAEIRNKLGDAHGKGQSQPIPQKHEAALAVNLAGSVTIFLVETWQL